MTVILHRRSSDPGKIPMPDDLALGELAINTYDGKIYLKRDNGTEEIIDIMASDAYELVTANFLAKPSIKYLVDTSAGTFVMTLPANPQIGDWVAIADGGDFEANPLLVLRNGGTIDTVADDLAITIPGARVDFIFNGATWCVSFAIVGNAPGGGAGGSSIPGYAGSQGFTGSQGVVGFTGSQGAIGFTGSQGLIGFVGSAGTNGTNGVDGATGFTGSQGVVGFTGSVGADGADGAQGATGFTGSQGTAGDIGATGFTGSQGTAGDIGATGFTGSQGTTGGTGVTGFTGSAGTQGTTGFTGSQGTGGTTGFTGSQGTGGATGFTGSAGTGGATGFTGSAGTGGATGFTGSQGTSGGVGFTGSQGTGGTTGFTGSQGAGGATGFTGSAGTGTTGFTGSQGTTGFTGSVAANQSRMLFSGVGPTAASTTASVETQMQSVTIPANTLEAGDRLILMTVWRHGGGTVQTPRMGIRFGSSTYVNPVNTTSATDLIDILISYITINTTTSQTLYGYTQRDNGSIANTQITTASEDITGNITISYRYRFDAGAETEHIDYYSVFLEKKP